MLFLKRLFGTGKPAIIEETGDRVDYDVSTNITPEKIDRIMTSANTGDTEDQCRLSREILEKNADIMQALSTRKNAVIGCGWRLEPGDDSEAARMAAEQLQTALRACGGDGSDAFEDLLEDLLGALLPGFAVSEILWLPGGGLAGFHHIGQKNFTFVEGYTPRLVTSDNPRGVEIDPKRIIFHRVRFHGGDPARGGLIRPLAWLHCFKTVGEKDLLSFIERHGMPFVAAKVDETTFEREKNLVKRLIRNFGSAGGGIFTKNVELQLLDSTSTGEAYFRLLEYLEAAVNKVILGQTASSGDSSGLSKGDAQSSVRQDILESDCRILQRTINAQLLKPLCEYNFGGSVAAPQLVINCAAPEDSEANANTLKTLFEAGFEADEKEVSERFGWNLRRRSDETAQMAQPATGGIRQPITLKTAEEAAVSEALDVDDRAAAAQPLPMAAERGSDPLEEWFGPVQQELAALAGEELGEEAFKKRLLSLASGAGFGDSGDFEQVLENVICAGIAAGRRQRAVKS